MASISSGVTALVTAIATAINARMGAVGASAADIARANGFVGTDAQFATYLQSQLVGINPQLASYTLVLADAGKLVTISNGSATTLTVPLNSSVAYPIGTVINLASLGAGAVTITPAAGVTIASPAGSRITTQYGQASLIKTATDTWLLSGLTVV